MQEMDQKDIDMAEMRKDLVARTTDLGHFKMQVRVRTSAAR